MGENESDKGFESWFVYQEASTSTIDEAAATDAA